MSSPPPAPTAGRLAAAGASVLAAVVIAWHLLPDGDGDPDTVELVDDTEEVNELLAARSADGSGEGAAFGEIPEEDARRLFPPLKRNPTTVYDPDVYYHRKGGLNRPQDFEEHPEGGWTLRTNARGMREDEEVRAEKPDLRVLVVGDSHTEGVCENDESFANVLEALLLERHPSLAIEVLNAGTGSWSFYNYLGALEKYRDLEPDVFVVAVYGGNDFLGVLRPYHYLTKTTQPAPDRDYYERLDAFREVARHPNRCLGQAVFQLAYLNEFPEEAAIALDVATEATSRIVSACSEQGILPVLAYLPPAWDTQIERYEPDPEGMLRALEVETTGADGWADRWLEHGRSLGAAVVDPRERFREDPNRLYWQSDHHINLLGHRRMAEALLPAVEAALD